MSYAILTPEIVQNIIYFTIHDLKGNDPHWQKWVLRHDYVQYATVSRTWQYEIERQTFSKLYLNTNRLPQANSIITPRRRGYVRSIMLDIVLPRPKGGPFRRYESDEEKLQNNSALQATFEAFFESLSEWKEAEVRPKGIELVLEAFAPGDQGYDEERTDSPGRWERRAIWERRHERSILQLTDPKRITQYPHVTVIGDVEMANSEDGRYVSGITICTLLQKLSTLKSASVYWRNSIRSPSAREDIALALSQIGHPMDGFHMVDEKSVLKIQEQSASPDAEDKLSSSIHILSQHLKYISVYNIVISNEIFWPRGVSMDMERRIQLPRWDRMEVFILDYPPCSPSGEWLFLPDQSKKVIVYSETPPGSDDSSASSDEVATDIRSRGVAAPAMHQFYIAAANAALQMPCLQNMSLIAQLEELGQKNWHKFMYTTKPKVPLAVWTSSSKYVPEDDILQCWRNVSTTNLSKELEVQLSDDRDAV